MILTILQANVGIGERGSQRRHSPAFTSYSPTFLSLPTQSVHH